MSFVRVNPSGWSVGDRLTSAHQNSLDSDHANAVDKTIAGDTVSGVIVMASLGRIVPRVVTGADAATTYTVISANIIQVTSAVTADRVYTLSATSAVESDVLEISVHPGATKKITVNDQAAAVMITLGAIANSEAQASWARFVFRSGAWSVLESNARPLRTVNIGGVAPRRDSSARSAT